MGLGDCDPESLSLWVGDEGDPVGPEDSVSSLGLAVGSWLVLKHAGGAGMDGQGGLPGPVPLVRRLPHCFIVSIERSHCPLREAVGPTALNIGSPLQARGLMALGRWVGTRPTRAAQTSMCSFRTTLPAVLRGTIRRAEQRRAWQDHEDEPEFEHEEGEYYTMQTVDQGENSTPGGFPPLQHCRRKKFSPRPVP